ncbi:MAG: 4-hydroxythreonine-4-phosphate dehydrogenase PdxA [Gammaproteobacteria bacterium]|nr:4-hydroxythreonine-4-phosphate dehydrogenase PdxA [Gammaproteobacteria bacterium]
MPETSISRLAITPGEPGGIGPDLVLKLATQAHDFQMVAIGDLDMLKERADTLDLKIQFKPYQANAARSKHKAGQLEVLNIQLASKAKCGSLDPSNALYILETLQVAAEGCQKSEFDALVTGPIHKGIINEAGIPFTGHTEYLAEQCGGCTPVMMLATEQMRVALVTTHLPLCEVSKAITKESLEQVIHILNNDLIKRFGLENPAIYICGLNPHAGENGYLGREEIDTIQPVINQLREQGLNLSDALPADTLFTERFLKKADVILAMYHDQGLPVLKHSGFGKAVNITLGLPIIRTSVDHGTALELSGTGKADCGSFLYACQVAHKMAQEMAQQQIKTL